MCAVLVVVERGRPQAIRCDNGSLEGFKGNLAGEYLEESWIENLRYVRRKIAGWHRRGLKRRGATVAYGIAQLESARRSL